MENIQIIGLKRFFYLKIISPKFLFKSEYFHEVYCFRPNLLLKCLANFELPAEEGSPFNEILFVELDREKAQEVVDLYNKVGLWLRIPYIWNRIPTGANFGQTDQWLRSEYIGFAKFDFLDPNPRNRILNIILNQKTALKT